MTKLRTEEKNPLLFYFVEANQGNEFSKTNKRLYFNNGRWHGINSGATAVFSELPNQLSSCWVLVLLVTMLFFTMLMLLISGLTPQNRFLRCATLEDPIFDNHTIHLVHGPNNWTQNELDILDKIAHSFPKYKINLVLLKNISVKIVTEEFTEESTSEKPTTGAAKIKSTTQGLTVSTTEKQKIILLRKRGLLNTEKKLEDFRMSIQLGARRLLDILLNNRRNLSKELAYIAAAPKQELKTLGGVLNKHITVTAHEASYINFFRYTPLQYSWSRLNENMKIFAIRVLLLWQYGGITFDLHQNLRKVNKTEEFSIGREHNESNLLENDSVTVTKKTMDPKLYGFIKNGKNTFENLQKEFVAADLNGLHIETKTPCHAFLEEILQNLKGIHKKNTTVYEIMRKSFRIFCIHSTANRKFCDSLNY